MNIECSHTETYSWAIVSKDTLNKNHLNTNSYKSWYMGMKGRKNDNPA